MIYKFVIGLLTLAFVILGLAFLIAVIVRLYRFVYRLIMVSVFNRKEKKKVKKEHLATLAGLALSIPLMTGCAQTIDEGERGVKLDLGKMKDEIVTPGFHFYNPFTEDIVAYQIRQQKEDGKTVPLTKDQQDITLEYSVWYRIPEGNVTKIYSEYKGDPYHTLVEPQVQEAFRDTVAKYKAEEVIHNVEVVKAKVLESVRSGLKGVVVVVDIPIRDINLPKSLQHAIEVKQVEEQKALAKHYELEKERKQAEITVTKAKAEAESIRLQAQALRTSPELIKLKWVEKWNGKMPVTMLGNDSQMLYGMK